METKKFTTRRLLRISIILFLLSAVCLPFWLISMMGGSGTDSNMFKIVFALLVFATFGEGVLYLIIYLRSRKYSVTLYDKGLKFENCAVRINGAKKEYVGDIDIAWSDIKKVQCDTWATPVIHLSSGDKISVADFIESSFGAKAWKEIARRHQENSNS